jgi:hypothetical protein
MPKDVASPDSEGLQGMLVRSAALDRWIWDRIGEHEMPASLRNRLALAAFSVALYQYQAMLRLIESKMFPTAYALVRVQFEACVNGLWIANCADDAELDRLSNAAGRPKIDRMVARIENVDGFDERIISKSKAANWSAMSDYTHCGSRMLQRMNDVEFVGPNFCNDELREIFGFCGSWALMSALGIARMRNDDEFCEELLKEAQLFTSEIRNTDR